MKFDELKDFLDEKADLFNRPEFIENDPIQVPHRFSDPRDIEIAGFLTATISWGNRKAIIKSADYILDFLENSPYDFVRNASEKDFRSLENKPVHRTFNGDDLTFFLLALQRLYRNSDTLETYFETEDNEDDFYHALHRFRTAFFEGKIHRSSKHVSSTYKNSSAKRLMMFLRWMVRNDNRGVDLGIWKNINPKYLSIPLDVHTANISRQLTLLTRKQNDWKAVKELDGVVRKFNPDDPAVYDFALFGLGATKSLEI